MDMREWHITVNVYRPVSNGDVLVKISHESWTFERKDKKKDELEIKKFIFEEEQKGNICVEKITWTDYR